MDESDIKRLVRVAQDADSVDGQLTNFKKHCRKATDQAKQRFKEQGKDVPSWEIVAKTLAQLDKATVPALKAVDSVHKLVGNKKKLEKLEFSEAKKELRGYIAKMKPADDAAASVLTAAEKVFHEIGLREAGSSNLNLKLMIEKYGPFFIEYYSKFKVNVNKL